MGAERQVAAHDMGTRERASSSAARPARRNPRARPAKSAGGLVPLLAVAAIALWSILFFTTATDAGEPWWMLAAIWSMPVLLVIAIWLLVLRYMVGEGGRLDALNRALSDGPGSLDERLSSINDELTAARDLFADHPREMTALGNLGTIERQLGSAVETADAIVARIEGAGASARARLEEVSQGFEKLSAAGEASNARLAALLDGLKTALDDLERSTANLDQTAEERFGHLRAQSERFKAELDAREADNLAAIRRRADELAKALSKEDIAMRTRAGQAGDELQVRMKAMRDESLRLSGELEKIQSDALRGWDKAVAGLETRMRETVGKVIEVDEAAMENSTARLAALHAEAERIDEAAAERLEAFEARIAERRDASTAHGAEALAELEEQLDAFDQRLDERRKSQLARLGELGERSKALAAGMSGIDQQLAHHVEQCEAASNALGSFAGDLSERLAESREHLEHSGQSMGAMTEASERLFELIRSSADYTSSTIPAALADAETKLADFDHRTRALHQTIGESEAMGEALVTHLEKAKKGVPISAKTLDALGQKLERLAAQTDALAERTRTELAGALTELESSTQSVAQRLREGQERALKDFATDFGERSLAAIGQGLTDTATSAIADLQRASQDSTRAGREAIGELKAGIGDLEDKLGHLETRVAKARDAVAAEPTKDFSIEMTKLIEKLNSASIDLTKAFGADVPDNAWQAYLRGDYGVFTRRAVKLMPSQQADMVHGLYRQDGDFRELTNRYIQDFESMLRVVLATRNGHQMAVTLLSSDIGKLYVALAQATERLRE